MSTTTSFLINPNSQDLREYSRLFPAERSLPSGGEGEGWGADVDGILPIAKSTLWQNWSLPGHGESYRDCGDWRYKGCLNVEGHAVHRLDCVSYEGKVFVKRYRRSCDRAECPICYEKWASRAAFRAERRLKQYCSGYRRPIHVIVSPSQVDCDSLDYAELRLKAYNILKKVGIEGGVCIVHPFRENEDKSWYLSPHFHFVCYGWIRNVGAMYEKEGWIVKNLGIRKSVYATLHYQLTHAGVHRPSEEAKFFEKEGKKATITWFGALSYNKLKVEEEEGKEKCPVCEKPLVALKWIHWDRPPPLPEEEGEYFVDPEGWRERRVLTEF